MSMEATWPAGHNAAWFGKEIEDKLEVISFPDFGSFAQQPFQLWGICWFKISMILTYHFESNAEKRDWMNLK